MAMAAYMMEARHKWNQARGKVFWARLHAQMTGQDDHLLDFNEIARRLHLKTAMYRGVQNVPLDQIVGSVGRYQDFNRAFLPVSDDVRDRWQRVAAMNLDPTSGGLPPIELYKVGDAYFVKDGNHRVSVARQLALPDIESYVWEYPAPVEGLDSDADIDTLLIEAERREFLDRTRLDTVRPGHGIRLTAPGGYNEMLEQIDRFREALAAIDGLDVPYEDAVTAWYDMLYEPTVQLCSEAGLLNDFADRTPADAYVWTARHQQELADRYGKRVMVKDAARAVQKQASTTLAERALRALVGWWAGWMAS